MAINKHPFLTTAVPVLILVAPAASAEQKSLPGKGLAPVPVEQVRHIAEMCESCHGPGGRSTREEVPSMAGMPAKDIMGSLEEFYYYERHCSDVKFEDPETGRMVNRSMCDVVNGLNRQEGLALGKYFEDQ